MVMLPTYREVINSDEDVMDIYVQHFIHVHLSDHLLIYFVAVVISKVAPKG